MKKIICLVITITLLFTTTDTAFAKKHNNDKKNKHEVTNEQKNNSKDNKQEYEYDIEDVPVFKYDRYKLPVTPVMKGMGASVDYNDATAVLSVTKGSIKIEINFKEKTVYVNGVKDNSSGIFSIDNDKKMTVLIQYIAKLLGIKCDVDDDEVIVEVPGLDSPTNVTVIPIGQVMIANTVNSSTLYLTASANITAGQATGGKAELYVGSKKVATDTLVSATDTTVNFTTSDDTPTNAEMQVAVPFGGVVTVKLYNASNKAVGSTVGNPTLKVDYVAPTLTGITSANYNSSGNLLKLNVTNASGIGDKVDVTKITLYDSALGRSYQLTSDSSGSVVSSNVIEIKLGTVDKNGLTGFGSTSMYLTLAAGSLLSDAAGNVSTSIGASVTVPVTVVTALDAPTNVTVSSIGTTMIVNALNNTSLYLTAAANITAGQATGGRAELYVGSKLVAVDSYINSTDTTVNFTTSDSTPTNAELQSVIPTGGVVTVKLFNVNNVTVTSTVGNPTLAVDYVSPAVNSITSAIYSVQTNQLYLIVAGASSVGDKVDVTKLSFSDSSNGRYYQLTSNTASGSSGKVNDATSLLISIGSVDKLNLSYFGTSTTYLTVSTGSLLADAAGNTSAALSASLSIPVMIVGK